MKLLTLAVCIVIFLLLLSWNPDDHFGGRDHFGGLGPDCEYIAPADGQCN